MELKNIPYAITERYLEGKITANTAIERLLSVVRNTNDNEARKACVYCIDRIERISGM